MGIKTGAVYPPRQGSLHVNSPDEAFASAPRRVGTATSKSPRFWPPRRSPTPKAIHPGYGFLSENAEFSRICTEHDITFIGPSPEMIRTMGDKATAKDTMIRSGVPVVPGSDGIVDSMDAGLKVADEIGFPVIIKATAGGGGRGMRIVRNREEFAKAYDMCQNEALNAFGDAGVYVEKFVDRPRHIEIQVLGDKHGNVIHLGERECSLQRRHQKILEEAPSPVMTPELRERMGQAAIKAAKAIDYEGAGTIEFLVDADHNFYSWR
jgi:Acetyl/propionyl-CoA carboxylase, alpha subunit